MKRKSAITVSVDVNRLIHACVFLHFRNIYLVKNSDWSLFHHEQAIRTERRLASIKSVVIICISPL